MHNLYEAYLYKYKYFILLITYFQGIKINYLLKDLKLTFDFDLIDFENDLNSNYKSLNKKIDKYLKKKNRKSLLIYGYTFPLDKLEFKPSFSININTSLNRFLSLNSKNTAELYSKQKDSLNENKINKFFNLKDTIDYDFNTLIFNAIIDYFNKKLIDT